MILLQVYMVNQTFKTPIKVVTFNKRKKNIVSLTITTIQSRIKRHTFYSTLLAETEAFWKHFNYWILDFSNTSIYDRYLSSVDLIWPILNHGFYHVYYYEGISFVWNQPHWCRIITQTFHAAGEIKLKSIWVRHVTRYYTMRVPLKGYAFDEVYLPVFNGQV